MRNKRAINRGHRDFVLSVLPAPIIAQYEPSCARATRKAGANSAGSLRWNKVHCPRRPILNINANRNQPAIKETDMGYVQERHIPSRAEIVIGMVGDAIRRVSDRRKFARFVNECPGKADRLARDLNIDKASLQKLAGSGN